MQVDWLTVGAQVVNFLLLVALLQRFLYRPVHEAMTRRERHIADRLGEASERERMAQDKAAEYELRMARFDASRQELLADAAEKAEAHRRELLARAREALQQAQASWRKELLHEQREFLEEVRQEIARAAESVTRRALADLAGADLEGRMLATLLQRIDALDEQARHALVEAVGGITVRTAFSLDAGQRSQTTRALHQRLGRHAAVHYERDEALICGVALEANGHRLGWSVADYLHGLECRLRDRLSALEADPEGREPVEARVSGA